MIAFSRFLKRIARHAGNVVRWIAYEFLRLSIRNTLSSRLTDLCRLLGFVTVVLLMMYETGAVARFSLRDAWYAWVLDVILALLVGNIVKECAISVSARIANSFGRDFYRKGVMLNGKSFSEVIRSDGTWRRCEFSERETVCEWTDRYGGCTRSVTGPRRVRREAWGGARSAVAERTGRSTELDQAFNQELRKQKR